MDEEKYTPDGLPIIRVQTILDLAKEQSESAPEYFLELFETIKMENPELAQYLEDIDKYDEMERRIKAGGIEEQIADLDNVEARFKNEEEEEAGLLTISRKKVPEIPSFYEEGRLPSTDVQGQITLYHQFRRQAQANRE